MKNLALLGALALALAAPAAAGRPATTRGDAEAALNAFLNGGRTLLFRGHGNANGSPAEGGLNSRVTVRPFGPFAGKHVCVSDWHLLVLGFFDGGPPLTRSEIVDGLQQVSITLRLDGITLETTRTAIKRVLAAEVFGFEEAYGFQQGAIFAPGKIALGAHGFRATVTDPVFGTDEFGILFFVDGPGSAACSS